METKTQATKLRPGQTVKGESMDSDSIAAGWENRSAQEALDEVTRELQVRERCFPNWIADGRLSSSDAKDRFQRLIKAAEILQNAVDSGVPF